MSAKRKNTTVETGPAAKAQAVAAAGDAPGYASAVVPSIQAEADAAKPAAPQAVAATGAPPSQQAKPAADKVCACRALPTPLPLFAALHYIP